MKASGIITLLTDFGHKDPYVGIMKGVILSINPEARLIDLTHEVRAGDVLQGAALIRESYPFFSEGTVHVAVIDPGVGGDRRPIAVKTETHVCVGPDNGLFWPIITSHEQVEVIHLEDSHYFLSPVSDTFHGRDIFAPVAAHISLGKEPLDMGPTISDPVPLEYPEPRVKGEILSGRVMRIDHFGNVITNIHRRALERFLGTRQPIIRVGNLMIEGIYRTYPDVEKGELLGLMGSSDCLEISVHSGKASERLEMDSEGIIGAEVEVSRSG